MDCFVGGSLLCRRVAGSVYAASGDGYRVRVRFAGLFSGAVVGQLRRVARQPFPFGHRRQDPGRNQQADPCDCRRHGRPHRRQSVRIRQGPLHKSSEWHDERLRSPGTFFGLDRAVYP